MGKIFNAMPDQKEELQEIGNDIKTSFTSHSNAFKRAIQTTVTYVIKFHRDTTIFRVLKH